MTETQTNRPLTLGEQRQLAAELFAKGRSYAEIARIVGVSPIRARDLCLQYEKYSRLHGARAVRFELSQRAILCLLTGKRGSRIDGNIDQRLARLLKIAASYSRKELMAEEGVGIKTVDEIGNWLASKGLSFRSRNVSVSAAALRANALTPAPLPVSPEIVRTAPAHVLH